MGICVQLASYKLTLRFDSSCGVTLIQSPGGSSDQRTANQLEKQESVLIVKEWWSEEIVHSAQDGQDCYMRHHAMDGHIEVHEVRVSIRH